MDFLAAPNGPRITHNASNALRILDATNTVLVDMGDLDAGTLHLDLLHSR